MHAELNLLIGSGGLVGKQHTYALLDERVPATPACSPNSFINTIVVDGQVVGGWRRVPKGGRLLIETSLLRPLAGAERVQLEAAVERYRAFVGMPACDAPHFSYFPQSARRRAVSRPG